MNRALILGAALLAVGCAHSQTFRGDRASCDHLALVAGMVADERDSGTPWKVFSENMQALLDVARENPGSYVKDKSDAEFIMGAFKRIYDNPSMTAEEAAHSTQAECMKKPAKWGA